MALLASTFDQSRFLSADDLKSGERKFKIKEVTAEDVGNENNWLFGLPTIKKVWCSIKPTTAYCVRSMAMMFPAGRIRSSLCL
jgi:hypothetical protein